MWEEVRYFLVEEFLVSRSIIFCGAVARDCGFDFWMSGEVIGEFYSGVEAWVDDGSGSMASNDVVYDRKVCATEDECIICVGVGEMFCDDTFDVSCGAVWVFDSSNKIIGREVGDGACMCMSSEKIFVNT